MTTSPEPRPADGDGGSSDDDRQPDDTGETGTLGDRADDRPIPRKDPGPDDAPPQ